MSGQQLRVGGQALADGVFMRTDAAWAIARADGTVETGAVPPNPVAKIPVVRVLVALGVALQLGLVKGLVNRDSRKNRKQAKSRTSKSNKRFLTVVVASEVVVAAITWLLDRVHLGGTVSYVLHAVPLVGALVALRYVAPSTIWRYHGAEHKAVTAHEAGVDLDDVDAVLACSRIHPRCGTNLVVLVTIIGVLLQGEAMVIQIAGFLLGVAVAAELLTLAGRWPRSIPSRLLLVGGRLLQAHVTTKEPTADEQRIACVALHAALVAHAELTTAAVDDLAVVAAAA